MSQKKPPFTEKDTQVFYNSKWYIVGSSMQGWRLRMQDYYKIVINTEEPRCIFLGIYDGHGGHEVSRFASQCLHRYLFAHTLFVKQDISMTLEESFVEFDKYLKYGSPIKAQKQGSAAVVLIIRDSDMFCANLGDCGAVAFKTTGIELLSHPHKPYDPLEMARIRRAGFEIIGERVEGNLSISRSFGDFQYKERENLDSKQQAISSVPDVVHLRIDDELKYIALASDGIWDTLTPEQLSEEIEKWMNELKRPEEVAERVLTRCLAGVETNVGTDNMSLILAFIRDNLSPDYKALLTEPPLVKSTQIEEDLFETHATTEASTSGLTTNVSKAHAIYDASTSRTEEDLSIPNEASEASTSGLKKKLSKAHAFYDALTRRSEEDLSIPLSTSEESTSSLNINLSKAHAFYDASTSRSVEDLSIPHATSEASTSGDEEGKQE